MKCVETYKPAVRVIRLTDAEARAMVAAGKAKFVPKSEWKKTGRNTPTL